MTCMLLSFKRRRRGGSTTPVSLGTTVTYIPSAADWDTHKWVSNESITTGQSVIYRGSTINNLQGMGVSSSTGGLLANTEVLIWTQNYTGGGVYILENGGVAATYTIAYDLFSKWEIKKNGANLECYHNGVLFHTKVGVAAVPYYATTHSYDGNGRVVVDSVAGLAATTRSVVGCTAVDGVPVTDIFANDANIYYSKFNWLKSGTKAESPTPGASFKFRFTGGAASILIDARGNEALVDALVTGISWRIDGGAWQTVVRFTDSTVSAVQVASGLSAGAHLCEVMITESYLGNRVNSTASLRYASIFSYGVRIKAGESLTAYTPKAVTLLAWGDSNSEAAEVDYPLTNATKSYAHVLGAAMNAEVWLEAYPGQGWITTPGSNVPIFEDGWDFGFDTLTRLTTGALVPEPTYISISHGQNDASSVTASATATINAMLAATTNTKILVCVPCGTSRRAELIAAVAAVANARCVLLDNTTNYLASYSVNGLGIHLTETGQTLYGNTLAAAWDAIF